MASSPGISLFSFTSQYSKTGVWVIMGKLENRVAIVTGASSGMGKEIARLFAQEGASVVAIARHKEKLQGAIDEITLTGGKATTVAGDVSKEEDIQNVVKAAVEKYGRLDIV